MTYFVSSGTKNLNSVHRTCFANAVCAWPGACYTVFTRGDRRGDRSRDRSPRLSPRVNTIYKSHFIETAGRIELVFYSRRPIASARSSVALLTNSLQITLLDHVC